MDFKAFQPTKWKSIGEHISKKIIPSHMFLKEKLLANGEFDRMKSRLVAGGNFVDTRSVGETNAPTLNQFTVFFMLNVAAQYGLELLTADIKGAYLIPDIVDGSGPDTYMGREDTDRIIREAVPRIGTICMPQWLTYIQITKVPLRPVTSGVPLSSTFVRHDSASYN